MFIHQKALAHIKEYTAVSSTRPRRIEISNVLPFDVQETPQMNRGDTVSGITLYSQFVGPEGASKQMKNRIIRQTRRDSENIGELRVCSSVGGT